MFSVAGVVRTKKGKLCSGRKPWLKWTGLAMPIYRLVGQHAIIGNEDITQNSMNF